MYKNHQCVTMNNKNTISKLLIWSKKANFIIRDDLSIFSFYNWDFKNTKERDKYKEIFYQLYHQLDDELYVYTGERLAECVFSVEKTLDIFFKKSIILLIKAQEDNSEKIIGMCILNIVPKEYVYIYALFISKEYRKNNIGSDLFSHIYKLAKQNKCNKVHVTCHSQNSALDFYKKCGFEITYVDLEKRI